MSRKSRTASYLALGRIWHDAGLCNKRYVRWLLHIRPRLLTANVEATLPLHGTDSTKRESHRCSSWREAGTQAAWICIRHTVDTEMRSARRLIINDTLSSLPFVSCRACLEWPIIASSRLLPAYLLTYLRDRADLYQLKIYSSSYRHRIAVVSRHSHIADFAPALAVLYGGAKFGWNQCSK